MIEVFTHNIERMSQDFFAVREDLQKELGVKDFLLVFGALSTLRRTLVRIYADRVLNDPTAPSGGGDPPEA